MNKLALREFMKMIVIFATLTTLFLGFGFFSIYSSFADEEAEIRSGAFCSSVKIGELPQDVFVRALSPMYKANKERTRVINENGKILIHAEFTGSFLHQETYVCSINAHPRVTDFSYKHIK